MSLGLAGILLACGGGGPAGTGGSGSTGGGPVADAGTGPATPDAGAGAGGGTDAGNPGSGADAGSGSSGGGSGADAGPATPARHTLDIHVNGSGDVQGAPSDCRTACQQQLNDGQKVHLVAAADSGWKFDGWQGACNGSGACDLTITADTSVTGAFSLLQPPPADPCAGLMPASLPAPVVPSLTCNGGCLLGTSDDGAGNFALTSEADPKYGGLTWSVFQMENGQPVFRKMLMASDQSMLSVFSEPSGFTLSDIGFDGASIYTYSPTGQLTGGAGINGVPGTPGIPVDPSGGFGVVLRGNSASSAVDYTFKRFDKTGAPVGGPTQIFSGSPYYSLRAAGTTLSHDTLAIFEFTDSNGDTFTGLWIGPDGNPTGSPFRATGGGPLQFLLDGSLLQHSGNQFTVWADGATAPSPTPAWLAARGSASWLYPIRHGAGYAMGGTCGGVEVLARDGASCGCLAVPGLSARSSIGRDGSLIVPLGDSYALYPLLFH